MYGLVLEGGGAKGSYHIGAYKAMLEEGINIQGVAGTSIGALNGAMIVQGDHEICYKLWEELSYSMIIDEEDDIFHEFAEAGLNLEDLRRISKKAFKIIKRRGFSVERFRYMLDKYIDEDKVRASHMDFGIVTFNLTDFKPVEILIDDIPYGELKDYLMASAYLPVFRFERLGGKLYLDGGVYDNLPFRILQNEGYKKMILVRTHGRGIIRKINEDEINSIVISPSDDIGYSFTFEAETARRNIKLGYYDGLRALRGLVGDRYYIDPKLSKDIGFNRFSNLSESKMQNINELLGYKSSDSRRALFEYSIPKLGLILGSKKDFTYDDIIISLLEKFAEYKKIDRFELYEFEVLLELAKSKKKPNLEEIAKEQGILEKFIEKVDISTTFNKESLILEIGQIVFSN